MCFIKRWSRVWSRDWITRPIFFSVKRNWAGFLNIGGVKNTKRMKLLVKIQKKHYNKRQFPWCHIEWKAIWNNKNVTKSNQHAKPCATKIRWAECPDPIEREMRQFSIGCFRFLRAAQSLYQVTVGFGGFFAILRRWTQGAAAGDRTARTRYRKRNDKN